MARFTEEAAFVPLGNLAGRRTLRTVGRCSLKSDIPKSEETIAKRRLKTRASTNRSAETAEGNKLEPVRYVPAFRRPALASTAAVGLVLLASLQPAHAAAQLVGSLSAGFSASFVLILASEIGDKTFFISALLAMKYSRAIVFIGSVLALGLMTVISVLIGQVFHALPTTLNSAIPFDDYAAVALLLFFGYQNIRDALSGEEEGEDGELKDAEEFVKEAESEGTVWWRALTSTGGLRLLLQTFSLVFVAEWGDKSMIATIALAAAKSPLGVVFGGIVGHIVATMIAVLGGFFLGKYVSERNARLIGGVLFLVFALLTLLGIY
mmetsp:Transcript_14295/g.57650  ORF Transcript_14295/g.57650 Transcript_14295/m.57650 type:complete len:322 (-) Transcript_14295:2613-3578(-)